MKGQLSGQLKLKAPLVGGGRGGGRVQGSKLANSGMEVFTKGSGTSTPLFAPSPHPWDSLRAREAGQTISGGGGGEGRFEGALRPCGVWGREGRILP